MRRSLRLILSLVVVIVSLAAVCFYPVKAEDVQVSVGVGDTTVLVQGSTSPGALVTIMEGNAVIGTVTADANGHYSKLFTHQTPGLHTYQLFAEDTAGRTTDTVTVSSNVTEHQQTVVTVFLPPTIQVSNNEVVQGNDIVVTGMSVPNAEIVLYIDQTYVIVTTNAKGEWHYTLHTADISLGEHQIYAVAVKSNGEQSYPSALRTLIVKPQASVPSSPLPSSPVTPFAPVGRSAGTPDIPRITSPSSGARIAGGWVAICGVADPTVQIEVWNHGQLIGSVFSDNDGRWCLRYYLSEFSNEFTARACRGDICSAFSAGVRVFREGAPASDGLDLKLNRYRLRTFVGEPISLLAKIEGGEKPYVLVIEWGNGERTTLDKAQNKQFLSYTFTKSGTFSGVATVTDRQGSYDKAYFSVEVIDRGIVWPWWVLLFWLFLLIILLCLLLLWYRYRRSREQAYNT